MLKFLFELVELAIFPVRTKRARFNKFKQFFLVNYLIIKQLTFV